ncbi:MAG: hypothetical protein VX871_02080 [Pseudomonadota bacterium]|nr:hypothetical protein [Pseudomonadota bacterium]
MLSRIACAAVAVFLLLSSSPARAGAKFIHVPAAIPTASGPVHLHAFGGSRKTFLLPRLAPALDTPVYFPAGRMWTDRYYLRGPDFPTMTRQLQGRIDPGVTVPNAANPYGQRIPASQTVANGSPWRGVFAGGPTVEGGSIWSGQTWR